MTTNKTQALSPQELVELNSIPPRPCAECGRMVKECFCLSCEDFFWRGHDENCSQYQTDVHVDCGIIC